MRARARTRTHVGIEESGWHARAGFKTLLEWLRARQQRYLSHIPARHGAMTSHAAVTMATGETRYNALKFASVFPLFLGCGFYLVGLQYSRTHNKLI